MGGFFVNISFMNVVVGIDEVGRGCWAGPLVAAAVILDQSIDGLNDSKLLSKNHRGQLAEQIYKYGTVGLGWVEAKDVDILGLTESVRRAMQRALESIEDKYDQIIIDGNINFLADDKRAVAIVKADVKVPAVSAASIIAKVSRDAYMKSAAAVYPVYGFERHVGYGTKMHYEMLKLHGACKLHRHSYKPLKTLALQSV